MVVGSERREKGRERKRGLLVEGEVSGSDVFLTSALPKIVTLETGDTASQNPKAELPRLGPYRLRHREERRGIDEQGNEIAKY